MNLENILPAELGFNNALDDDGAMHLQIKETLKKYGDIINHDTEFNSYENLTILYSIADLLSNTFGLATDEAEGRASIYRTVCFINQVTDIASCGSDFDFDFGDYLTEFRYVENVAVKLNLDAQNYLETRPGVDAFIVQYMPELDVTDGRWNHLVEITAAIMFKIAERDIAKAYISSEIELLNTAE